MSEVENNLVLAQVGALAKRLDKTIEQLSSVSVELSKLLAVQASRLEFQEKASERIQNLIEKRREETDATIDRIYQAVGDVEEDLNKRMDKNHEKIVNKIDNLQADVDKRMNRIEKIVWLALGGGAVIGIILPYVNFAAIF